MKTRITSRDLKNAGKPVIIVGYCGAQALLSGLQPVHYNAGIYGWNYDVYELQGTLIVTGYRFTGVPGKHADYELLRRYEKQAETMLYNYSFSYDDRMANIAEMRAAWIREALPASVTFHVPGGYTVIIDTDKVTVCDDAGNKGIRRIRLYGRLPMVGKRYFSCAAGAAGIVQYFSDYLEADTDLFTEILQYVCLQIIHNIDAGAAYLLQRCRHGNNI